MAALHPSTNPNASGNAWVGTPTAHPLAGAIGGVLTAGFALYTLQQFGASNNAVALVSVAAAVMGFLGVGAMSSAIWEAHAAGRWRRGAPAAQVPDAESLIKAQAFGIESRHRFAGRRFEEVEGVLARQWITARGASRLYWEGARAHVRHGWEHGTGVDSGGPAMAGSSVGRPAVAVVIEPRQVVGP